MKKSCSGFKKKLSCISDKKTNERALETEDFSSSKFSINRKKYNEKLDIERFESLHGKVKYAPKQVAEFEQHGIKVVNNVILSDSEQELRNKQLTKRLKKQFVALTK